MHHHVVSYVVILILANFHAITKIIFTKIHFHLKSVYLQNFYATKTWSYTVMEALLHQVLHMLEQGGLIQKQRNGYNFWVIILNKKAIYF